MIISPKSKPNPLSPINNGSDITVKGKLKTKNQKLTDIFVSNKCVNQINLK